jgi:hypothetical protein
MIHKKILINKYNLRDTGTPARSREHLQEAGSLPMQERKNKICL